MSLTAPYGGVTPFNMALEIIRGDEHAPLAGLAGRTIAIIGYGNQGRAHALNLHESAESSAVDYRVVVGARTERLGNHAAKNDGIDVVSIDEATSIADLVIIALPDEVHQRVYETTISPSLKPGASVGFLHGFSVHYGVVKPAPEVGIILLAPKGPGAAVRDRYQRGYGLPCLLAIHQDSPGGDAESLALGWANGIGAARAGIIRTTFAQETETDLFGEQAVLCGGMLALIQCAIETLVGAGYPRELAYLECCHEMKQIADLVYERGLSSMSEAISTTAEFGMFHAARKLDDDHLKSTFAQLLADIRSGEFATIMQADAAAGSRWLDDQRLTLKSHPNEAAGTIIRSLMPWLDTERRKAGEDSES